MPKTFKQYANGMSTIHVEPTSYLYTQIGDIGSSVLDLKVRLLRMEDVKGERSSCRLWERRIWIRR